MSPSNANADLVPAAARTGSRTVADASTQTVAYAAQIAAETDRRSRNLPVLGRVEEARQREAEAAGLEADASNGGGGRGGLIDGAGQPGDAEAALLIAKMDSLPNEELEGRLAGLPIEDLEGSLADTATTSSWTLSDKIGAEIDRRLANCSDEMLQELLANALDDKLAKCYAAEVDRRKRREKALDNINRRLASVNAEDLEGHLAGLPIKDLEQLFADTATASSWTLAPKIGAELARRRGVEYELCYAAYVEAYKNRLLGTLSDDMLKEYVATSTDVMHAACAAVVIGLRLLADGSKNADDTPAPAAVGGGTTVNAGGTGVNGRGGVTMEIGLADRSAAGVADQGGERQEGEAAPPRDGAAMAAMEAELGALRQENANLRQSNQALEQRNGALERRMAAAREHLLGNDGADEDGSDDDLIDEDVDGVLV